MNLEHAVHLVHGDSAAAAVRGLAARDVLVRRDLLTVGPCDVDPARHRALRAQFWGRPPSTPTGLPGVDADDDLRREIGVAGRPIVVWASRAWSDLTYLWALVDALVRLGVDRPWIVRPGADDPTMPTGGIDPVRLRGAFDAGEPLSDDVGRSCITFWNAYADPSPIAFDDLRRRAASLAPGLDRTFEGHGAWFPWREGATLRIADADAAILGGTAEHVVRWIGDACHAQRLAAWEAVGATDPDRLKAVPSVAAFPPLWVGGCRVNDPASPWVRVADHEGWHIERL